MQKHKHTVSELKAGHDAIESLADTIQKVVGMVRARGEQPSTALIAGYITIMTTRVLDDFEKGEE